MNRRSCLGGAHSGQGAQPVVSPFGLVDRAELCRLPPHGKKLGGSSTNIWRRFVRDLRRPDLLFPDSGLSTLRDIQDVAPVAHGCKFIIKTSTDTAALPLPFSVRKQQLRPIAFNASVLHPRSVGKLRVRLHVPQQRTSGGYVCSLLVDHSSSSGFIAGLPEDVWGTERHGGVPVTRSLAPNC